MSKRNKSGSAKANARKNAAPAQPATRAQPQPIIPDAPPMSGKKRRWPLWLVLGLYAAFLAGLAYLAVHSARWGPGG